MQNNKIKGFGSLCTRSFHHELPEVHAHAEPIYATSTFTFKSVQHGVDMFQNPEKGYVYSRWNNPTIEAAERKIAALETHGLNVDAKALLHSSGMGAITTLFLSLLKKGDKVITQNSLYGGTNELLNKLLPKLGIEPVIVSLKDIGEVEEKIKEDPAIKMIYIETPANPTSSCMDLEALSKIAAQYNLLTATDNTYSTPYLQQPFKFGIDYVVHSATKYLNGHGTCVGGVLVGRDTDKMNKEVWSTFKLLGGNSNAFDAWLILQGMKTLELRMDRHCTNAMQVAKFLDAHPAIKTVNYPGLPAHPDHELAKKQMRDFGGMLSFELKGGLEAAEKMMNSIKFCTLAVSLGTVDTLVQHPASMTHAGVPKDTREAAGITDGLIRMSVGIENAEDIIADLEQAINPD